MTGFALCFAWLVSFFVSAQAAIFTTASADAFRFTDDMRQELSEREITHCMKRDEFRDYTEALAKVCGVCVCVWFGACLCVSCL